MIMLDLLNDVNSRVNAQITYQAEQPGADHWQTRQETQRKGFGDCEDYAIYKYQELRDQGLHPQLLYCEYITPGEMKGDKVIRKPKKQAHMVCLQGRMVLDNINTNILMIDERTDLNPVYVISEEGLRSWRLSRTMPPSQHSVFYELWQRIQRGE